MNVCGIKPIVHPFSRLKAQVAHMGVVGSGLNELSFSGTFACKKPNQVRLITEPLDNLSKNFKTLLFIHRTRIKEHNLMRLNT